jgi:bud emergence protein 1
MPGPADEVDDALSATRQQELDDYLRRLCYLNRTTARYVLEHNLTREFLALKPGDVERDTEPQYDRMADVGWYEPSEEPVPVSVNDAPSPVDDVSRKLQQTSIKQTRSLRSDSDASDYAEEPDANAHSKSGGNPQQQRQQPHTSPSKTKPHTSKHTSSGLAKHGNGHHTATTDNGQFRDSAYSRSSASSSSRWVDSHIRSSASARSTKSGGSAGAGTPTISASVPQTAFVKIKIFDRIQDDLIAIRVHPRVTHEQLLDKVQQRLGGQVARLSYREAGEDGEDFVPLQQDDDVLWWIGSTDKHVLYAD